MPRVSVIVPNYNHLRYLPERLKSIESQTYRDFEIILLDDCSTDGSKEYLKEYEAKCGELILNSTNSGSAFRQWQKGIERARGELIWIAESDDTCSPELLQTLVTEFDSKPNTVLAFCASMRITQAGSPLGIHPYQQSLAEDLRISGEDFIKKYLLKKNYVVNASGALFCKSATQKVGEDHLKYKGVGDWLFWVKLAMQGDVAFVCKPLNNFRQHSTNTTASLRSNGEALLELKALQEDFTNLGFVNKKIFFSNRVYAVASVRYGNLCEPLRSKVLQAWGDNVFISLCAWLKHIKQLLWQ